MVLELHVHLVFVTKRRRHVLDADALHKLKTYLTKVCEDFDASLAEFNGEDDHVHLLVGYSPTVQLSRLVNSLKGASSRLLQRDRPDLAARLQRSALWSPSYFAASCGGPPLAMLRAYIEHQRGD